MKPAFLLAAALTALLCCGRTAAEESPWYGALAVGRYFPESSEAFARELDDGLAADLRLGYQPAPWFAVEGGATGYRAEGQLPPVDVTELTIRTVATTGIRITAKALWPLATGRVVLFAGAGFGRYSVKITYKEPPATDREGSDSDTGTHFVAGATLHTTAHTTLGLEYEQLSVSPGNVELGGAMARLAAEYRW